MEEQDRRSYFRVPTRIAVRHRRVSDAELVAFERELALRGKEPPIQVDPGIQALFARLERKLDELLARLAPDGAAPLGVEDVRDAELSGSGVRYVWNGDVSVGDRVLVEMLVPGSPTRLVRTVSEVVFRDEPREDGSPGLVAVRFDAIDETDREAIIRYTYEVQRVALRNRAAGDASQ